MTRAISGRVTRLERAYRLYHTSDDDEAALLQRVETLLPLIPTPDIRMLLASCHPDRMGGHDDLDQHRAVREKFVVLVEIGVWPI